MIPIIENTPHEADLADSLGEAIRKYPKARINYGGIYIYKNKYVLYYICIFIYIYIPGTLAYRLVASR